MTLAEMKERLATIDDKILEMVEGGEEYSIVGSHTVKNGKIEDLRKERALLVRRILRYQGYTGRVKPKFN